MGIGNNGHTLKEMLEERNRLTKETGHFYGVKELKLVNEDLLKFENFCAEISTLVNDAKETARSISASPGSREVGELMFGFLMPEGDVVSISLGLMAHVGCMPNAVRWMIDQDYEENPGIKEGDLFTCNDPKINTPHPPDVYMYTPIFYEGELVGWAGGCDHILEVGSSIVPGSSPSISPNIFTDGFVNPPLKMGEKFEIARWWEWMWRRRTRMGDANILDDKMRAAGIILIHDRVLKIIGKFGIDYYKAGIKEIIELSTRELQKYFKLTTVPGLYCRPAVRTIYYGDIGALFPQAAIDQLVQIYWEMEITSEGRMKIDLEGTSKEGLHSYHGFPANVSGMLAMGLLASMVRYAQVNAALYLIQEYNLPKGSLCNPTYEHAAGSGGWGWFCLFIEAVSNSLCHSLTSRGYLEEGMDCTSIWMVGQNEGVLDDGTSWGGGSVDFAGALPTGAFSMRDGLPLGWVFWNPQSDFGNLEEWDLINPPMMQISRTLGEQTVGHGRFRGGFPCNSMCLTVSPGRFNLAGFSSACSANTTCGVCGVMGGYPGTGNWDMPMKNTNIKQLIEEKKPYPRTYLETKEYLEKGILKAEMAKLRKADSLMEQLNDGDLWLRGSSSGGGYGDPIDRDPELAADDVKGGWITLEVIKKVYGVVLIQSEDGSLVVDEKGTERERMLIRQRRKERSVTVKKWWAKERETMLQKQMPEIVLRLHRDSTTFDKYREKFMAFWQIEDLDFLQS